MPGLSVDDMFEMLILSRRTVFKAFSERDSRGLPPAQLAVMLMLLENGPMQMSQLASRAHTSRPNLTMLVERLHKEGLVQRTQSESDRRVVEISMTKKAVDQFEQYKKDSAENMLLLIDQLDQESKDKLAVAVKDINSVLRKLDKLVGEN